MCWSERYECREMCKSKIWVDAYLCIELVEDVFQVVTLDRLLRVEELKEFLDKLRCYIDFEGSDLNGLIYDQLQKEFVNSLEMGPGRVHFLLLVDTGLSKSQIALFHVWKGSENVLLNHVHHFVKIWDDVAADVFLVLQNHLKVLNCIQTLCLSFDIFLLIFVIKGAFAKLNFLEEGLFRVLRFAYCIFTVALGWVVNSWVLWWGNLPCGFVFVYLGSHYDSDSNPQIDLLLPC